METSSHSSASPAIEGRRLALGEVVVSQRDAPAGRGLELLTLAAEHKRVVILAPLLCGLLGLAIGLLLPNQYTAATQLLPPQTSHSAAAAALGQLGDLAALVGKNALPNTGALFVSLLESRSIADRLIARFALAGVYGEPRLSQCRQALADRTHIENLKQAVIRIEVQDRDPRRASDLANAYVEELTRMNQTLAIGEAAQRRSFFEGQVRQASLQLANAEDELKGTQKATGIMQLDAQGRVYTAAAAELRARVAARDAELEEIGKHATAGNPDYIRARHSLEVLRHQLEQLEASRDAGPEISAGEMADAGAAYVRRLREVKYRELIFEMLAKQLEVARLDEAKSAGLIQVIDPAEPPDRKSGPSRSLIALAGVVAGSLAACLWIAARQRLGQWQSDPAAREQLEQMRRSLTAGL